MGSLGIETLATGLKMAPGYVRIAMDQDNTVDQRSGFQIVRQYEQQMLFKSRYGTVVAVCEKNCFFGDKIHPFMNSRNFGPSDQNITSRLTQRTCYFDVPIEVKEGDRVLVKHNALVQDHMRFGDDIVVKYDQLVARVDGDNLVPLNGMVFLEMADSNRGKVFVGGQNEFGVDFQKGKVVAEGCLVKKYLMFPESVDFPISLLGKTVYLSKGAAARIELDDHQVFGLDRKRPLYATYRHFINAWSDMDDEDKIAEDVIM